MSRKKRKQEMLRPRRKKQVPERRLVGQPQKRERVWSEETQPLSPQTLNG